MKFKSVILVFLFCLLHSPYISLSSPDLDDQSFFSEYVTVSLTLEKERFIQGEAVPITVCIANNSNNYIQVQDFIFLYITREHFSIDTYIPYNTCSLGGHHYLEPNSEISFRFYLHEYQWEYTPQQHCSEIKPLVLYNLLGSYNIFADLELLMQSDDGLDLPSVIINSSRELYIEIAKTP